MDKPFKFSTLTRREFVAGTLSAVALPTANVFAAAEGQQSTATQRLTVQQIIDVILKEYPGQIDKTVDTLKCGNPQQAVSGIVTSMFATPDVIQKAIELKANFIIVHEPTFYNHQDETDWLVNDKVFQFKKKLLDEHGIAVWRYHDYIHKLYPDGIRIGVMRALGWEDLYNSANPRIVTLPPTPLKDLISYVKNKLGIQHVRIIGNLDQSCTKVLLMPGASGGRSHIQYLQKDEPDVLICGEVAEWETSEYVRDARAMGMKCSLIVLGHAQSEEPGMAWLVGWLQSRINGVSITHVPAGNPFSWS